MNIFTGSRKQKAFIHDSICSCVKPRVIGMEVLQFANVGVSLFSPSFYSSMILTIIFTSSLLNLIKYNQPQKVLPYISFEVKL